ncbi:MAG: DNA translocase FtsK 4TM domain-containing protein [Firmicutes bacterium]|nr:DNA translocase FtsK 4TM domain-containing protein [Bacillota bacterium]
MASKNNLKTNKKTSEKKNSEKTTNTEKKTSKKASPELSEKSTENSSEKAKPLFEFRPNIEVISIIAIFLSTIVLLGVIFSSGGIFGQAIGTFMKGLFGLGAYILPLITIGFCVSLFFSEEKIINVPKFSLSVLLFLIFIGFVHLLSYEEQTFASSADYVKAMYKNGDILNGGLIGACIGDMFHYILGSFGSFLLFFTAMVCCVILLSGKSLADTLLSIKNLLSSHMSYELSSKDEEPESEYDDDYIEEEPPVTRTRREKPSFWTSFLNFFTQEVESEEYYPESSDKDVYNNSEETKEKEIYKNDTPDENKDNTLKKDTSDKDFRSSSDKQTVHRTSVSDKISDTLAKTDRKSIVIKTDDGKRYKELKPPVIINIRSDYEKADKKDLKIAVDEIASERLNRRRQKVISKKPDPRLPGFLAESAYSAISGNVAFEEFTAENTEYFPETIAYSEPYIPVEEMYDIPPFSEIEKLFSPDTQMYPMEMAKPVQFVNIRQEYNSPAAEQPEYKEEQTARTVQKQDTTEFLQEEAPVQQNSYEYSEPQTPVQQQPTEEQPPQTTVQQQPMKEQPPQTTVQQPTEQPAQPPVQQPTEQPPQTTVQQPTEYVPQSSVQQQQYENRPADEHSAHNTDVSYPEPRKQFTTENTNTAPASPQSLPKPQNAPLIISPDKTQTVDELDVNEKLESNKPYVFPKLEFLKKNTAVANRNNDMELIENSQKLVDTLASFHIGAEVINISQGPTVTRYELSIEEGIKVSKITNLADNLALSLAATSVRIEAPIPGKSAVGIEIPNAVKSSVFLSEILCDTKFRDSKSKVSFGMGKDIAGNVIISDIAKMPHLLVAGQTGAGKSVCVNTLITSILYKSNPDEVKLIMVDPKVVELTVYNGIPHLLVPVITEPDKAKAALDWAVYEMDERYKLMAKFGVRNLAGYNKIMEENGLKKLPLIVIIIDELADLMMVASKEIEAAICRLAQKARAAGLHIIIATQRPSTDVITGLIKANIPSRIAFTVSSNIDSRTILDSVGAEKLLGKGDMLFKPVERNKPLRIQGAFVSDEEVEKIVGFIKENNEVHYDENIMNQINSGSESSSDSSGYGSDDLTDEVIGFLVHKGKGSTSLIQRKFGIGYNRAARIMEELEDRGIVGPASTSGSKQRDVLMDKFQYEEYCTNKKDYI